VNLWVLAGTSFLASAVEFVEAATIVMAVGYAQSWRAAAAGAAAATLALAAAVALFGQLFASAASLQRVELVIGPFLVLFGGAWLRKAVLRYAGRKAMHDEAAAFEREMESLRTGNERGGFVVAFQGVFVEGLEVAVIVVTFSASRAGAIAWSVAGAAAALVAVALAAIALRKPFSRVPENTMKALVGTMLLSLGTLWTGEGLGLRWWGGDAALLPIAAAYVLLAGSATLALRATAKRERRPGS